MQDYARLCADICACECVCVHICVKLDNQQFVWVGSLF